MRTVLIEWLDSKGVTSSWEFKEDIAPLEPSLCRSVGFLYDDGDDYKTLLMTDSEQQILGRLTIPASAIRRIQALRPATSSFCASSCRGAG